MHSGKLVKSQEARICQCTVLLTLRLKLSIMNTCLEITLILKAEQLPALPAPCHGIHSNYITSVSSTVNPKCYNL